MLEVAHANNVELEGACGGELACSTCHLIFEPHVYETLPPKEEDEDDMLDLAFEVTETYVGVLHYMKEEQSDNSHAFFPLIENASFNLP